MRSLCSTANGEKTIVCALKKRFPQAKVEVQDISGFKLKPFIYLNHHIIFNYVSIGGCGAMYDIFVETSEFNGLSTVKQHRLVTETLKTQIKEMHGLRIQTAAP